MAKTNICIVGLSKQFTDNICKQLANKLEMYYANIEEIFEYDLMDMGKIEEVCGIDYLKKEQKSIISRVCSYDNTLIYIDYILLNDDEILSIVNENCLIVYLYLNEKLYIKQSNKEMLSKNILQISKDVYSDRDVILKEIADISVECDKLDQKSTIESVINKIVEYYE